MPFPYLADRPKLVRFVKQNRAGCGSMTWFDTRLAGQLSLLPIFAEQIDERKRKVFLIPTQRASNRRAYLFFSNGLVQFSSERPQCTQAPLTYDPVGVLRDHTEISP